MPARSTSAAPSKRLVAQRKVSQARHLLSQFMGVEKDGALAQCVREVVANSRRQAVPRRAG